MKQLWAPWRMEYINLDKSAGCIFCTLPAQNDDARNYILHQGARCFAIMNIFPYNSGHLMVSPYRHLNCITLMNDEERVEMEALTRRCVEITREVSAPDGFNIGMNLGKAAGAGFDEHIHVHIVPRWQGDTNFMPVLGETKVHPEHLRATYDKILPHFQKIRPVRP
ncbi:MAG: HIT family hydrolase [Nitrospinae bacterium CG11_big_fil_rev_8_21_14_0_20_56_8]|nr:MAG: HIT family hydrolase [Nitrospinae bacterium CG11_big_fil_rev_8_21_14_0_20_56_8]